MCACVGNRMNGLLFGGVDQPMGAAMYSVICFNSAGNQSLWLNRKHDAVPTPMVVQSVGMFRRGLLNDPADFTLHCAFEQLPEVEVVWQAVFPSVGFAQFRFDDELAATSLMLS